MLKEGRKWFLAAGLPASSGRQYFLFFCRPATLLPFGVKVAVKDDNSLIFQNSLKRIPVTFN